MHFNGQTACGAVLNLTAEAWLSDEKSRLRTAIIAAQKE
jgi:hypothetical protein